MEKRKYIVGVVGKELFPNRMHLDKEIANVLYEQLISVLEIIGEESKNCGMPDLRLGVYLDTNNNDTRNFLLNENNFLIIEKNFGHQFYNKIKRFAHVERKKGTEVLFQLNNGELTLEQVNDKLK